MGAGAELSVAMARYRATSGRWHALARCLPVGACGVALAAGGCSFSYQLDNALAKKDDAEQVGSLRPALAKAAAEPPAEADLAIARAALSEVLAKAASTPACPGKIRRPERTAPSRRWPRPRARMGPPAATFSQAT